MSLAYHFYEKLLFNRKSQDTVINSSYEEDVTSLLGQEPQASEAPTKNFKKGFVVCVVAGLFMGGWSPLSVKSMKGDDSLTPYTSMFYFTVALLVSTIPLDLFLMRWPFVGSRVGINEYFHKGPFWHLWGFAGGIIWTLGTLFNLISGNELSFAISYAIGQSAPMVAVIWGILLWREFWKPSPLVVVLLFCMFLFYVGAVVLVALSGE